MVIDWCIVTLFGLHLHLHYHSVTIHIHIVPVSTMISPLSVCFLSVAGWSGWTLKSKLYLADVFLFASSANTFTCLFHNTVGQYLHVQTTDSWVFWDINSILHCFDLIKSLFVHCSFYCMQDAHGPVPLFTCLLCLPLHEFVVS